MNVILAGDSLTEGLNVSEYFPGTDIMNKGVYGDNLEGLIARLDRDVISLNPELLFILIGTNDFALGRSNSEILGSFKKMINKLSAAPGDSSIYITSLLPTRDIENRPNERIDDINKHLEVLVTEAGFAYLPLADRFRDEKGKLRAEATTDGLHLSEKGYAIWAEVLGEYIQFHSGRQRKAANN